MKRAIIFVILSSTLTACGFASNNDGNCVDITIINPTRYKKIYIGPCSFRVKVEAYIEDKYGHWKENVHNLSARFGDSERTEYSTWDSLGVSIPCGACEIGITGMISVLDSKAHLMPWGCGQERPPLNIINIHVSYKDRDGAVDIADVDEALWENDKFPIYEYDFNPQGLSDDSICDGEPVLFDLTEACEALIPAGVLEERK